MQTDNLPFYAKIMLFGEYSLMAGSMALVVPYTRFSAVLRFYAGNQESGDTAAVSSNRQLAAYCRYLSSLEGLPLFMDDLKKDVDKGLFLDSDIPGGYGLGSSGALVAALCHKYGTQDLMQGATGQKADLRPLKQLFSRMESYFHGTSSGLDPMCSFIRQTLLLDDQGDVQPVAAESLLKSGEGGFFLVDTRRTSKTAPLVEAFREASEKPEFARMMREEYVPVNNRCVRSVLFGEEDSLPGILRSLSGLQYRHFPEMIPEHFKACWRKGLESRTYALKLCGSGGGGYLLGYTQSYKHASAALSPYALNPFSLA